MLHAKPNNNIWMMTGGQALRALVCTARCPLVCQLGCQALTGDVSARAIEDTSHFGLLGALQVLACLVVGQLPTQSLVDAFSMGG
jgi:uncharacterized membrane protein YdcZ (DUF606 family)